MHFHGSVYRSSLVQVTRVSLGASYAWGSKRAQVSPAPSFTVVNRWAWHRLSGTNMLWLVFLQLSLCVFTCRVSYYHCKGWLED